MRNSAAEEQHDALARDRERLAVDEMKRERRERLRQTRDPRQREEQQQPRDERHRQAELARLLLLLARKPAGENRDEDEVVDAEDDLEQREREHGDPRFGRGECSKNVVPWILPDETRSSAMRTGSVYETARAVGRYCPPSRSAR